MTFNFEKVCAKDLNETQIISETPTNFDKNDSQNDFL